jgi:hypothetical protein
VKLNQGIVCGEGFELVRSRFKVMPCFLGDFFSNHMVETFVSIESSSHSSPSLSYLQHIGQGPLDSLDILLDHMPKG